MGLAKSASMTTANDFEPHLVVNDIRLPPSAEWLPKFRSWTFIQIRTGISYWQESGGACELAPGSTMALAGAAQGGLRASQLSEVLLSYSCMELEKLDGLLSISEKYSLKNAAAREHPALRILPPNDPVSERFGMLCRSPNTAGFSMRWQLLQLFMDAFRFELEAEPAGLALDLDGRGRLRQFLKKTAASEFLSFSLADLASRMHCSPRHLSRLFCEEVGGSFRDKQTEMRLAKACQLLATSNAKVIDVALTCGYQSNSVFSLMFKKRFGVSPGAWRQKHGRKGASQPKFQRMLRN